MDKVPYAVNQEVFRLFQFDPALDIDQTILSIAVQYGGEDYGISFLKLIYYHITFCDARKIVRARSCSWAQICYN